MLPRVDILSSITLIILIIRNFSTKVVIKDQSANQYSPHLAKTTDFVRLN